MADRVNLDDDSNREGNSIPADGIGLGGAGGVEYRPAVRAGRMAEARHGREERR